MRILTTLSSEDERLLRRTAKRVKNVQSTEVIFAIQDMKRSALEWEQETGMRCEGLAAPQIGINLRIVILRANDEMVPPKPTEGILLYPADDDELRASAKALSAHRKYKEFMRTRGNSYDPWTVLINPVILSREGIQDSVEGCLSVPGSTYLVKRPTQIAFKFTRPNRTYSGVHLARGLNAVKLQHELDHLEGRLLIDVAEKAYVGESSSEPL